MIQIITQPSQGPWIIPNGCILFDVGPSAPKFSPHYDHWFGSWVPHVVARAVEA